MFMYPVQYLVPDTNTKPSLEPFTAALSMAVSLHVDVIKADVYIDNMTTITVGIKDNEQRGKVAVLLAVAIVGRAYDNSDPIL